MHNEKVGSACTFHLKNYLADTTKSDNQVREGDYIESRHGKFGFGTYWSNITHILHEAHIRLHLFYFKCIIVNGAIPDLETYLIHLCCNSLFSANILSFGVAAYTLEYWKIGSKETTP